MVLEIKSFRPNKLSAIALLTLAVEIHDPFVWYAPDSTPEDILERIRGNGDSYLDVAYVQGKPVGFNTYYVKTVDGSRICYIAGISVLPSARGKGVSSSFIHLALGQCSADYLAGRTQNPIIYKLLRSFSTRGVAYPGAVVTPDVYEIASAVNESGDVDPQSLAVRDAHTFVRADRSFMKVDDDPEIAELFSKLGRDDGYVVVVPLN